MECEHHGDLFFLDILHQGSDVYITTVQVMQVNEIGAVFFYFSNKFFSFEKGKAPFEHGHAGQKAMHAAVKPAADFQRIVQGILPIVPVSGQALHTVCYAQVVKLLGNFSGTSHTIDGVNL